MNFTVNPGDSGTAPSPEFSILSFNAGIGFDWANASSAIWMHDSRATLSHLTAIVAITREITLYWRKPAVAQKSCVCGMGRRIPPDPRSVGVNAANSLRCSPIGSRFSAAFCSTLAYLCFLKCADNSCRVGPHVWVTRRVSCSCRWLSFSSGLLPHQAAHLVEP